MFQHQPQAQMQVMMQMQAQGPFPPPATLREYEAILPGSVDRVFKLAEKAQNDQAETVRFAQQSQRGDTARVHYMALAVSIAAIGGAVFCAWVHETKIGLACLSVPVFAVAKAFIDSLRAPNAAQQAQLQRQAQQQQAEQLQQIVQQMTKPKDGAPGK